MERTPDQNECIKFHYNLKKMQANIEKHLDAIQLYESAKIKQKKVLGAEAKAKYNDIIKQYDDISVKCLETATECYLKVVE